MKKGHSMGKCRICGTAIDSKPLFVLQNMPKSAQNFPTLENAHLDMGVNLELFECPACGTVQLLGEPVPYFRDVIRATSVSSELAAYRVGQFHNWLMESDLLGKRIIEIGCGAGDYTECLSKAGALAVGLEHSKENVLAAQSRGISVIEGFIVNEESVLPGSPFDGFIIMNYLEHIPDPCSFLRGIAANLRDEAYGIVEVPNADMVFRKHLYSELIQDHLVYYTERTLRLVLELSGFDILACDQIRSDYVISAKVKKRRSMDLSDFDIQQKKLGEVFKRYFQKMRGMERTLAVWGAGHQALANMSNLHMESNVSYVLDSAKFKQDHVTPASHIPIVDPSVLKNGEIGAVIIMAGSYSDEIAGIMVKDFPDILYAVLREDGTLEESI